MAFTKIVSPGIDTTGSYTVQELNTVGVMTAGTVQVGSATTVHSTGIDLGSGNITSHNINSTGIITATSFVGPVSATNGTFSGNVSIGGTLTYEDVTNIDSVGIITARQGIDTDTVRGKTNNSNLAIGARASNGAFVQTITIKPDRSVGLGNITNPTSILDVRQTNTGAATEIKLFNLDQSNATTQTAALVMTPDVRANGVKIVAVKEVADMSSSANKDLALTFQTVANNTAAERLRIASNGNIGIDCTPNDHNNFTRALDVNGPSGAAVYMRTNDSTSNCFIVGNYGSEAYINNVSNGNIRFYTQGTERLRITNTGSVGIGTNNPADKLSIYAPPNSLVFGAKDTTRGNHIFQLLADDSAGNGELRLYQNTASGTHLKTVEIASSGNSYLTAGNFGVGTATPGSKLTVYETGGNAKLLLQRANTANNTDDYGSVLWRSSGGTAVGAINVARATAENDGYMFFQTATGGSMGERLRITSDGKIGIGQADPQGDLHIGNISGSKDLIMHSANNGNARIRFREGGSLSSGFNEYSFGMVGSGNKMTVNGQGAGEMITLMGDTGLVGVNDTAPERQLNVRNASGSNPNSTIRVHTDDDGTSTSAYAQLELKHGSASSGWIWKQGQNTSSYGGTASMVYWNGADSSHSFYTNGNNLRFQIQGGDGSCTVNTPHAYGQLSIQQRSDMHPPFSIRHHDASLYKLMGTVGPNDRNNTNASNGGQYLHVRLRTVWNDTSMTMFRITGYWPYSDYTHSFVGMYRYAHNSYRTNPYGQTVHNLKRNTIHSIYNEAASPGYLVIVCDWNTNYTGLMFEHIGAGTDYGSYMQNDIEIIDSLRSSGTSALTF